MTSAPAYGCRSLAITGGEYDRSDYLPSVFMPLLCGDQRPTLLSFRYKRHAEMIECASCNTNPADSKRSFAAFSFSS
jgi:hypothetical protein